MDRGSFEISGGYIGILRDKKGRLKAIRSNKNVIVDKGLDIIASLLGNINSPSYAKAIAMGTNAIGGTADSGTTTTTVDAERTETGTDYWKGAYIEFTSGPNIGVRKKITAFNPATDTITHEAFDNAVAAGHTYFLTPRPVDTALQNEVLRKLSTNSLDQSANFPNGLDSKLRLSVTFGETEANGALTQSAIFDASENGNMISGDSFAVVNKGSSDVLTWIWEYTIKRGQ